MTRRKLNAQVLLGNLDNFYRVKYEIINEPLVSIVIPFKDMPNLLKMCIESIIGKSTYNNFEIIGISNNSEQKEIFEEMDRLKSLDSRISFYEYNKPFNYSAINNFAVKEYANGEHIILLNNDIEIITPDWIESMLEHSQRKDVGCVGAKLLYPNGMIQHAGVIIRLGGYAAHSHGGFTKDCAGYYNRLNIIQNLSAVTAACLMVEKSIFTELEGLDEVNFAIAYNDVDFCLRALAKGYNNIFTPYSEAYHYESISRGQEDESKSKRIRFKKEKAALLRIHKKVINDGDRYYNVNLTLDSGSFSLKNKVI